ncbi:glycosyltransferase family 2 protein [Carboxylicivirga caseinilyticus]|uniref:glycosyltransferase family 2 protein n=1 Tax=Carboxylicivirga caseinilyticus TaxID=3417572 RepID=UPI003D3555CC|nr:glycosyltransferase family 2 protein [Marinilabiliaceae bacterium A049]
MDTPLVSVLMTVYNREKFIAEAIESVLASSYQNWELIIVDDRSTDSSVEIARRYEQADARIKVFINEHNLGDYPNRNKAASYAKGKYLKYLDSDDLIYPHGLNLMVAAMEKFPEAAIGMSNFQEDEQQQFPYSFSSGEAYYQHFLRKGLLYSGPTGAIYRASSFFELKGFDAQYSVATDMDFNLKCAKLGPVAIFQRDLFWWRPHEGQEINLRQHEYESFNDKINKIHLSGSDCPLTEKDRKVAYFNLKNIQARRAMSLLIRFNFVMALKKINDLSIPAKSLLICILPTRLRIQLY